MKNTNFYAYTDISSSAFKVYLPKR